MKRLAFVLILLVLAVAVVTVGSLVLAQDRQSLAGEWLLHPGGDGPGFLLTFTVEGNKLSGKARGPQGDWPVSDVRYDGGTLSFKIHNGEEHLEASLKRSGEEFEGSFVGSTSGEEGRLRMRRKQ